MVIAIHPMTDIEETPQQSKSDTINEKSSFQNFFKSIKLCLIVLVSGLVIMSVVIISGAWVSSFGPAITQLSFQERDAELRFIINFIERTFNELVMTSVNVKQQFVGDEVDPYNEKVTSRKTFSAYKSAKSTHEGIIISSYVGDLHNYCFGTINWGEGSALFNITPVDQKIYYCQDWQESLFCNSSSTPNEVTGSFNLDVIMDQCRDTPNAISYTPSYADPAMPQYVFISLINCVTEPLSNVFMYYYGNDLTTGSISDFLSLRMNNTGAKSFIVETASEYLIAVDTSDVSISKWGKEGDLLRETALTVADPEINTIAHNLHKSWKDFECNKIEVTTSSTNYVSYYRLCTDTKIDWVIVLSIPEWKYIGSTVIAVTVSVVCSIVIVTIGILLGVVVSLRIVKPFRNLMDLFENVSNMELDNLKVYPSFFSEVQILQNHFLCMVKQIKLYRSFIPSHILSELDSAEDTEHKPIQRMQSIISKESDRHSVDSHNSKGKSSMGHSKTNLKEVNRFALYMEKRTFSVLLLRVKGFTELFEYADFEQVTKVLSELYETVNSTSKSFGVHISALENDNIYISINASSNQAKHEEKAATLSRLLEEKLLKVKYSKLKNMDCFKKKPQLLDDLCFKIAIHRSQSYCGNVGTNDSKIFTILGACKLNMMSMIDVAENLGVPIVCSQSIKSEFNSLFQTRFLDFHQFVKETMIVSSVKVDELLDRGSIYELGLSNHVEGDEWMYELQEKEKKEKWKSYNEGVEKFLEGNLSSALEKFQEYLKIDPTDIPALGMVTKCNDSPFVYNKEE